MGGADDSKIFMVVDEDPALRQQIRDLLTSEFRDAVIYEATDGKEAHFKMANVPPNLLVATWDPMRERNHSLTDIVVRDSKLKPVQIILISEVPSHECYVQEVCNGRLQFVGPSLLNTYFIKAVVRALNPRDSGDGGFMTRHLSKGDVLFNEGDQADMAYLVKSGRLRVTKSIDGKATELGQVTTGEFVGEMAHINGQPRSADVVAMEPTELVEIPLGTFDQLVFSRPIWSMALLKTLSRRLKAANG